MAPRNTLNTLAITKNTNTNFGIPLKDLSFGSGTTLSNLDGRLWKEVGHRAGRFFGEEAMIRARLAIQVRYLIALSKYSVTRKLTKDETKKLLKLHSELGKRELARLRRIESVIRHDLMALNSLLKELMIKRNIAKDIAMGGWVHWGLTTEDVDNLAKAVLLKEFISQEYLVESSTILGNLSQLATNTINIVIPGKTHLQTAVPTTLGKEVALFGYRLAELFLKLNGATISGKLAGAVGTMAAHRAARPKINWRRFSKDFVESLGIKNNPYSTQIDLRTDFVLLLGLVKTINLVLIDMSQDFRIYTGFGWLNQKRVSKEVGSSTMPQKINPIDFENSFGNANLSNWLLEGFIRQLPVSWLQRDLGDKTMLRNLGLPLGHSLLALLSSSKGLARIEPDLPTINDELASWSIIAEGIQIILRSEGKSDAYNTLKDLSRGKKLQKSDIREWIHNQGFDEGLKRRLLKLRPDTYIGYAKESTREMVRFMNKARKKLS